MKFSDICKILNCPQDAVIGEEIEDAIRCEDLELLFNLDDLLEDDEVELEILSIFMINVYGEN